MHRLEQREGGKRETERARGNQSITLGAAGQGRAAGVRACGGRRWGKSSKARGAGLSCLCFILSAAASSSSTHRSPPRAPPHIIRRGEGEHMFRAAIRRGLLPCPPAQLLRWPSNFKLSPTPEFLAVLVILKKKFFPFGFG